MPRSVPPRPAPTMVTLGIAILELRTIDLPFSVSGAPRAPFVHGVGQLGLQPPQAWVQEGDADDDENEDPQDDEEQARATARTDADQAPDEGGGKRPPGGEQRLEHAVDQGAGDPRGQGCGAG